MAPRRLLPLLCLSAALSARADDPAEVLVIQAGRVIPVAGPELAPGTVVVREGKVEAVGARVATPPGARVLELPDAVVMPALVDPRSRFGLASYSRDGNHADLTVSPEIDPGRGRFRPLLATGYGCLGLVPAGGGIPGRSAARVPGDGPREQLLLEGPGYLRVRFTSLPGDKATLRDALDKARAAIQREEQARKAWEEKQKAQSAGPGAPGQAPQAQPPAQPAPPAQGPAASTAPVASPTSPAAAFQPPPIPPELAPFVALLRGKDAPRLLVELGKASDLAHLDEVWGRTKPGARPAAYALEWATWSDLHLVAAQLGQEKALVVCPIRLAYEPYTRDRRNLVQELTRAGARVALLPPSDDAEGHRRALEAATALVRDGLSREAALAGLTRWPAAVLGLEGALGTIEPGRRADLLVLDGDPLAPGTRAERLLLQGREAWRRGAEVAEEEECASCARSCSRLAWRSCSPSRSGPRSRPPPRAARPAPKAPRRLRRPSPRGRGSGWPWWAARSTPAPAR